MSPSDGLIIAGRSFPGAQVCCSPANEFLQSLAYSHASYMAYMCKQSHDYWQHRFNQIREELNLTGVEICAESWKWQEFDDPTSLGHEMFKCWKYSTGHWEVASRLHKFFGAGMAKGENGIWYSTIIAAD